MIYYTKYAEKKFEILNKHQVFFTKEQIEDIINLPDKTGKGKYYFSQKNSIKVIYKKENDAIKILTFFPIKASKR